MPQLNEVRMSTDGLLEWLSERPLIDNIRSEVSKRRERLEHLQSLAEYELRLSSMQYTVPTLRLLSLKNRIHGWDLIKLANEELRRITYLENKKLPTIVEYYVRSL